jgi:mono/diheme cytochrome c family protein
VPYKRYLGMRRGAFVICACVWMVAAGWAMLGATSQGSSAGQPRSPVSVTSTPTADEAQYRAVLDRYCVACHNERVKTADLTIDSMAFSRLSADADAWEKVIKKLRTRTMPPVGMPRPGDETYVAMASWLETELDRVAQAAPNPGRPLIRRLNRTEYANAIRDLLGMHVDVASLLPPDDSAYGFDNISDLLACRRRCSSAIWSRPIA